VGAQGLPRGYWEGTAAGPAPPGPEAQILGTLPEAQNGNNFGTSLGGTAAQELQHDANAPCAKWGKMNFTPRQSDFYHVNDHGLLIVSGAVKWGLWMFFF
jgi:hypothetical protein